MKRKGFFVILLLLVLMTVTSCLPSSTASQTFTDTAAEPEAAGFLLGVWHGWIAPLSLIISIFDESVSIYERNNRGFWYDFGFYMAIISGFGGLSLGRKKRSKHDHH